MRTSIFLFTLLVTKVVFCQTNEIEQKFKEYQFSKDFLTESIKDGNDAYSFDALITTIIENKTTIEKGSFDPLRNKGKRWVLDSVDNKLPTKKQIKHFNKMHNIEQPEIKVEVDSSSWAIERDDDYLVISFKFNPTTLPKKYAYLGDCKGLAFFNKKTKMLEKAEFINEKPIKVNILNVSELDFLILYTYDENENKYLMKKQDMRMTVSLLGQIEHVNYVTIFSNYSKVK